MCNKVLTVLISIDGIKSIAKVYFICPLTFYKHCYFLISNFIVLITTNFEITERMISNIRQIETDSNVSQVTYA